MKSYIWIILVIAVLIIGGILFLGKSTPSANLNSGNTTPVTTNTTASVNIQNFSFNPAITTVSVGTTVTWTNNDPTVHTVTSDNGAFDLGQIQPGSSKSFTFTSAGTYAYHCAIHTTMKGTIIVQ